MGKGDSTSTSLAPGFRFHPTDEELVSYYLKRKLVGKSFRFDAISEIDLYKVEPWDLPGLSKLKSRDLEWYFFSSLDKKYGNGSRTNRATGEGYWKTTGKDRPVHHRSRVVGMKKTLVYHQGRAPRGQRTNWVMHEYKLVDEDLEKAGLPLEGFVLCRVFQKSGAGPKNGEQYGAPFAEEEWEKEEVGVAVPGEVFFEEPFAEEEAYIEQNDLDQSIDWPLPANVSVPDNIQHEDNNAHVVDSREIVATEPYLTGQREYTGDLDGQFFNLPIQGMNNTTDTVVRNEHMVQPPNNEPSPNYFPNEPSANCQLPNGPLLGSDSAGNDVFDDEYLDALNYLDPYAENPFPWDDMGPAHENPFDFVMNDVDLYLTDPASSLPSDDADQSFSSEEKAEVPSPMPVQQLLGAQNDDVGSSSKQELSKSALPKTAIQYPYWSQALLGNIVAPPANASELPSKDVAAKLTAAVHQASSSVRVTAGMIRIQDMSMDRSSRLQWSLDKAGNVNVLLSFDLPEDVGHTGLGSLISSKLTASLSRGWLRSVLGMLVFAVSLKIGSLIYAK